MGSTNQDELPNAAKASLSDALLFAYMSIVGHPVELHARDGSVYSGVFHTASVEGVILKKARMTKRGRRNSNLQIGSLVETLVVLSSELVQVVAKGVVIPGEGVTGNTTGVHLESARAPNSPQSVGNHSNVSTMSKKKNDQDRTSVQTENGVAHGDADTSKIIPPRLNGNGAQWILKHDMRSTTKEEHDVKGVGAVDEKTAGVDNSSSRCELLIPSGDHNISQVKPGELTHGRLMPLEHLNGVSWDPSPVLVRSDNRPASAESAWNYVSSSRSTSASPGADSTFQSFRNSYLQGQEPSKKTKEFKLNPGAKVFSPAINSTRSATPPLAPTIPSVTYMPSTSSIFPARVDPIVGLFMPHSTVPMKILPYTGISDTSAHPDPVARAQLLRFAGQHQNAGQHQTLPIPSTFVHSNPQPVTAGRMGQIMYMPLPQDLIQNGTTAMPPVLTRPLPTISQAQFPKHQGNFPGAALTHPPPLSGIQQLFATPNMMPLPSFLGNRVITPPGTNSLYHAKFP